LLRDENVQKDLELVDEQKTKLTALAEKVRDDMRAQFQGFDFGSFRDLSEEERDKRFAEMREKSQKVVASAQSELDQILLPHQKERLKQIVVQSQLRRQDTSDALSSGALAEQLGITDEQKEKLRAKQEEVQASIREKFEKIRQEAQNELFSVLTPEQQAKLKAMIGNPITFSPPQFGFGGGGPGGPGGGGFNRGPGGAGGGAPGGNAPLRRPADGD
jgi:Spy/CpxP family protein refolding chaperone